jgi:hypothetical protein
VVNGVSLVTPTSQFAIVLPRGRLEDVEAWRKAVRAVPGMLEVNAAPVQERVSRPALQSVLAAMRIEVDSKHDERVVEAKIQQFLEGLRMSGISVKHVTHSDGTRGVQLSGTGIFSGDAEASRRAAAFLRVVQ